MSDTVLGFGAGRLHNDFREMVYVHIVIKLALCDNIMPPIFFSQFIIFLRLFFQFKLTSLGYSDVFDNHQHYLQLDVSSFCSLGQQSHKFQLLDV